MFQAAYGVASKLLLIWRAYQLAVRKDTDKRRMVVLWIISAVLATLWLLGIATAFTFGGFIHFLLILAVALVVVRFMGAQFPA